MESAGDGICSCCIWALKWIILSWRYSATTALLRRRLLLLLYLDSFVSRRRLTLLERKKSPPPSLWCVRFLVQLLILGLSLKYAFPFFWPANGFGDAVRKRQGPEKRSSAAASARALVLSFELRDAQRRPRPSTRCTASRILVILGRRRRLCGFYYP